jgi:hypothetical protein
VQHEQDPAQSLPVWNRGLPSTSFGPGTGKNASTSDHSSSEMIHGRDSLFPTTRPTTTQAESHMINGFC